MTEAGVLERFKTLKVNPQLLEEGKSSINLMRTDIIGLTVQVVSPSGGETNLHAHANSEAIWYVLSGRVAFYTEGDQEVAKLGANEGLLIPRGTPYWFKCISEEPLVVLRMSAVDKSMPGGRIDYTERKFAVGDGEGAERPVTALEGKFFGG